MNSNPLTVVGLCAAALLAGFAARRVSDGRSELAIAHAEVAATSSQAINAFPSFPTHHSTDTVETLAALDDTHLYARLALWLVDSSEPEIAAFWRGYSTKNDCSEEISDLIFLNWVRLDPQRAIAGAVASGEENRAWRAWACNDPRASLAAAIATQPDLVGDVILGIVNFHPDWLREHFEELPEDQRDDAIERLSASDGGENPLAALNFLKAHGRDDPYRALESYAREDPWAALEWVEQNPGYNDFFAEVTGAERTVISTLADESPDELARIAERTPSGKAKLVMEAALFDHLIKTDPGAAMDQAKSATIPRIAAERYAAIGIGVVQVDPEQALQVAKDLLAACPDALYLTAKIEYPDGNHHQDIEIPGVSEFMNCLMARQPEKVMEMITSLPPESGNEQFDKFSRQWIEQDLVAYLNWLNQQSDPAIRQSGASHVVDGLRDSSHYQEAAEWASSLEKMDTFQLERVLAGWLLQDPQAPAGWLKTTEIPPDRKALIQSILDRPR